jgi:hypothetical protein
MLHTGHPNPGIRRVLRIYSKRWERSQIPVIVHLLHQSVDELHQMVSMLEGLHGVACVELGLPVEVDRRAILSLASALTAELPFILRLPFEKAVELCAELDGGLPENVLAVSLAPPRGAWPTSRWNLFHGRMYGPAVFPLALAAVQALVRLGVPVIGAGGVYTQDQAQAMLDAGAVGVQIDTVLWRSGWGSTGDLPRSGA